MKSLKYLFNFYINSSIHVALAVTALSAITALQFSLDNRSSLLLYIFFGAITGYNFIKFAGIAKLHHRSLAKNLRVIQIFSFLSFLALSYFAIFIRPQTLLISAIFGCFTLLYALPVFSGKRNLRTIQGVKIHIIALVWAGVSVLCPLIEAGKPLYTDGYLEFLQRYLLVIILLLPFEIRDLQHDLARLRTIPQRVGVRKTKVIGWTLLVLFIGAEMLQNTATSASIVAVLVTAGLTGFLILRSRENQSKYFASFWVEGIPVVWWVCLLISRQLF